MSVYTTVKGWVVEAVKNPASARKSVVAALTTASVEVAAFTVAFPEVSTAHATWFTAITAFLTGAVTFLSPANAAPKP